jgi:hypothetical protein
MSSGRLYPLAPEMEGSGIVNGRVDIARAALVVAVLFACAGCVTRTVTVTGSGPASTSPAAAASIVPATPSATPATLSGTCTTGFVTVGDLGVVTTFTPFSDRGSYPSAAPLYGGYQVTLTNTSNVTAAVKGFSVVFYDGSTELGSDGAGAGFVEFITPGHSFTWDEQTSVMNVGGEGAVGATDTCALVQWYQPSATS